VSDAYAGAGFNPPSKPKSSPIEIIGVTVFLNILAKALIGSPLLITEEANLCYPILGKAVPGHSFFLFYLLSAKFQRTRSNAVDIS